MPERVATTTHTTHTTKHHQTPPHHTGAPNAPDATETLTNAGINAAAVAILGTIVYRDVQGARRDRQVVEREETLATLQVRKWCGEGVYGGILL